MTPRKRSAIAGQVLFRWRSYLPLLLLVIVIPSLRSISYPSDSHVYERTWEMLCLSISLFGLLIRVHTVGFAPAGTSGRNVKQQEAASLNTTGMYSIIRNPLYLGNYLMVLGVIMFPYSLWPVLIYMVVYFLYYKMIVAAEEEFLIEKFGDEYREYAQRVPGFFPNVTLWQKPDLTFSLRNALKREYSGFFGIISSFTAFELIGNLLTKGKIAIDPVWIGIFLFGLAVYLTLRTLKKKTRVLHVEGR